MQKIQGWVEQGNTTLIIVGAAGTIARKVQGSFPLATITVYLAGTVTPASIYSDNSSTAKANPFTAATDGTWFFYAADGRYDVKLSGAGIASPFTIGDILAFDGPAAIEVSQPWINVQLPPYSAQGDGIADDYAAIIAAYNALPTGGTLLFPGQSTYNISQPWTLTRGSVRIVAVDPTAVLQYTGGATTYVVGDNGTSSTLYFNNEISNLTIRGNLNVQYGLQISSQHHSKFLNLRIQNVSSTGMFVKFAVGNQYDVRVSNNDCPGGTYVVQPACGVDFAGLDVNHAATASEAYLIVEGVAGSGIRMGFTNFMALKGFSESNNRGLEVYQQTENMSVISMDFENNVVEDVLCNPCYYSQFIGISSSKKFTFTTGRGVALIGGVFNDIEIGVLGENAILTGQLVYIGTLTDNNPEFTVRSPIINFSSVSGLFTPENRFYGDSIDVLNKQGAATLARVRSSPQQSGADLMQFTDPTAATVVARVTPSGAIVVGQNTFGRIALQTSANNTNMGYFELYIGATRYAYFGFGTAGNVLLNLENGGKFGINSGAGIWSRTLTSTSTWDPGSIAPGGATFTSIALTGVRLGDTVLVSLDTDLQGLLLTAYIQSSDLVAVLLFNFTAGAIDLPSSTVRLDVWQH